MLSIGGVSYDSYIQKDTYQMARNDIGYSWKDANHRKHIQQILKVQGFFEIGFVTDAQYNAFLSSISDATDDGYVTCTVFVQDMNQDKEIEAILTIKPSIHRKVSGTNNVNVVSVEIEEV